MGLSAILTVIKTEREVLSRDGYIMLFASVLFFIFIFNLDISLIEAIIFLLFYISYVAFLVREKPKLEGEYHFKNFIRSFVKFEYLVLLKDRLTPGSGEGKDNENKELDSPDYNSTRDIIILIVGLVAVVLGARYLVNESIFFAQQFGVSDIMIGITIVAVGTSLPELMVSVSAARKGYENIAIGNVIGSNISNIFLILGISGVISPISVTESTLYLTAPFMIFISLILLVFVATDWEIRRREGVTLITFYSAFILLLFIWYRVILWKDLQIQK